MSAWDLFCYCFLTFWIGLIISVVIKLAKED